MANFRIFWKPATVKKSKNEIITIAITSNQFFLYFKFPIMFAEFGKFFGKICENRKKNPAKKGQF